jgi:mono/diheme cytochrome c family protein
MKSWNLLVTGIALVVVALAGIAVLGRYPCPARSRLGPTGRDLHVPFGTTFPREFASNGQRIYFVARSMSGKSITFTGGPHWFRMHGGSCVSCHGPDGRGGMRVPMTNQIAPDIRYPTLTSDGHGIEGNQKHSAYTDETLRRAITKGLDPKGRPLDDAMPRWSMSERDLDNLIDYLKSTNAN